MTWVLVLLSTVLQLTMVQNSRMVPAEVISHRITTPDLRACPMKELRESARNKIYTTAVEILQMLYAIVPNCGAGLWYQVVSLNMSDPTQHCPSAWNDTTFDGIRVCARPISNTGSCPGTFYPVSQNYSSVCGRVIGYQSASPQAFHTLTSIDETYLDGVSITYGTPRKHIWSYASSENEQGECACPCAGGNSAPLPFVGNNYYCESAYNNGSSCYSLDSFFPNDPLWDGLQCEGACCTGTNTPPWFSVDLSHSTNDDIEVRICHDQDTNDEDTPIQLLELYVQ